MIKQSIFTLIVILTISGCASTTQNEYPNLGVTDNELAKSKWSELKRFPARYPKQAIMKSLEGCATVEYVITPDNKLKDVTVVESTNKYFSMAAKEVVGNWKWGELPKNIVSEPVKTQTRFNFCFDKENKPCSAIEPKYSCPGEDVMHSRGTRVR